MSTTQSYPDNPYNQTQIPDLDASRRSAAKRKRDSDSQSSRAAAQVRQPHPQHQHQQAQHAQQLAQEIDLSGTDFPTGAGDHFDLSVLQEAPQHNGTHATDPTLHANGEQTAQGPGQGQGRDQGREQESSATGGAQTSSMNHTAAAALQQHDYALGVPNPDHYMHTSGDGQGVGDGGYDLDGAGGANEFAMSGVEGGERGDDDDNLGSGVRGEKPAVGSEEWQRQRKDNHKEGEPPATPHSHLSLRSAVPQFHSSPPYVPHQLTAFKSGAPPPRDDQRRHQRARKARAWNGEEQRRHPDPRSKVHPEADLRQREQRRQVDPRAAGARVGARGRREEDEEDVPRARGVAGDCEGGGRGRRGPGEQGRGASRDGRRGGGERRGGAQGGGRGGRRGEGVNGMHCIALLVGAHRGLLSVRWHSSHGSRCALAQGVVSRIRHTAVTGVALLEI
ncbi:hypothetical protein MRB53_039629 [Persea americana]|nr:hypothetical protein MRB53_039629 [Persea americana]